MCSPERRTLAPLKNHWHLRNQLPYHLCNATHSPRPGRPVQTGFQELSCHLNSFTTMADDPAAQYPHSLLQLGKHYFPLLLANMQDIIHVVDGAGIIRFITPSVERVLGYRAEEMLGRHASDFLHPEDMQAVSQMFESDIAMPGSTRQVEIRLQHADGSWRDVELHTRTYQDTAGGMGAVVTTRDVTELRQVEAERRELLARERTAREAAEAAERRAAFLAEVSGVLDASLDYSLTLTNLARLLIPDLADYCLIDEVEEDGGTRRVAIAHIDPVKEKLLLRDDRNPPDADPASRPVVRVIRTGEPKLVPEVKDAEIDALARNPARRAILEKLALCSYMMVPLVARDRTLGAITLVSSESRRKYGPADLAMAEEVARRAARAVDNARLFGQSQQAARAREEVLAVVSHDLKNPLTTILLTASSMLDSSSGKNFGAGELEQLDWIARSSEQMSGLIHGLLEVARAESGQVPLDRSAVKADDLVAEAFERFHLPAQQQKVCLEEVQHAPGIRVHADSQRVLQVFANLIGNSIKFTPPGGSIALGAAAAARTVRFWVRDTGPGVAPEDLAHIFDRYWQARRTARGGTGLGLAIARGIVEAHGGSIWAESKPGEGSKFCFTLPIAD